MGQGPEKLLTVPEAAEYLGMAPNTIYVWSREGKLPSIKFSAAVRFRRADLEAWLDAHRLDAKAGQ